MKIVVTVLLIIMAIVLALLGYRHTTNKMPELPLVDQTESEDKKNKKGKKKDKDDESHASPVEVVQRWDMPEVLKEVSDITFIDNNSVACVQDEMGTIYIYDLKDKRIKREIPFASKGDYEGIALAGDVGYVVNSSGVIHEVTNMHGNTVKVKEYKTFLTEEDDVEALCYDKAGKRLLLAFKKKEGNKSGKGIYSFDLKSKKLARDPVYTIDMESASNGTMSKKNKKEGIRPSAMAIHPNTGDIYIIEGTNPQLLVLDKQGKVKSHVHLNDKDFAQPEGITFNSAGEMFISNEGKKESGNILKVEL